MSSIGQPTVCEINQFTEEADSNKNYSFGGCKTISCGPDIQNHADYVEALLKDGPREMFETVENVSETLALGHSGNTESETVSNIAHILSVETDSLLKSNASGDTADLIESYKAVIRQQAIELHRYSVQIEIEKEKYSSTVSCRTQNDLDHVIDTETKNANADSVADFRLQLADLNSTIKGLVCKNTLSAEKITKLEIDKRTLECTLNETIGGIKCELNVLKNELHNTKSELESSQEILKNEGAEDKRLIEKNESLTHELNNLQKSLEELKNDYMLSIGKAKDSKDRINGLEHELDRSTSVQKDPQQYEQEQAATADIVVIAKNLEKLKRQNTALDLRIQNSLDKNQLGPSVQTVDEKKSRPTYVVPDQCDSNPLDASFVVTSTLSENALETNGSLFTDDDSMSKHTKDERIEELQRRLDELGKEYMDKERWYQKKIAKLDTEARDDEKYRKKMYKCSMKVKENQIADLIEDFKVLVETKNEEHDHVRNSCIDVKKELKDQKTLLELEEANARKRLIQLNEKYNDEREKVVELSNRVAEAKKRPAANGKPSGVAARKLMNVKPRVAVTKLARASKAELPLPPPTVVAKRKVPAKAPAVKAPVVSRAAVVGSSKNQNVTKAPPAPTITITPVKQPKTNVAIGGSTVKLMKNGKDSDYNVVEACNRLQRERDQKINDLRKRYKQQKAAGIPIGGLPAYYVPPEIRWKI